jgi:hypothetical protein
MTPFQYKLWADKADAGDGQFAIALALLSVAQAITDHRTDRRSRLTDSLDGIATAVDGISNEIHRKVVT